MSDHVEKIIPEPDEASAPFWEAGLRGKLLLMRCEQCQAWRLPSRAHCDRCLSDRVRWEEASGRGTIRSFAVMHQRYHAGWEAELPYNIAVVELEEGPRLPTNIIGIGGDNGALHVGMRVMVEWERHDDIALPKFRRLS